MRSLPRNFRAGTLQSFVVRPRSFWDSFLTASSKTLTLTGIAVAVAWVPLFALCAFRGEETFMSFLRDYVTNSRFLIILPVLILAEPQLHNRLHTVEREFEEFVIPANQRSQFQANWKSHERRRSSTPLRIVLLLLTYATAIWLSQYLNPAGSEFPAWFRGGSGFKSFSAPGMWAFFVSYPIVGYFTYLWLWRQLLWWRFLRSTANLELRLVAAHPDRLGGLGFLEASILGQLPFSFCMGVALAGAVANRALNERYPLIQFRFLAFFLVAAVLLICVVPYLSFTRSLMMIRRRGMSTYGAFAHAVGEQFEKKWLPQTDSLTEDVLNVPDFSTTADLYGVVHNIDNIRVIPVGAVDIYAVVIAALIPAVPVLIASIPLDTLMRAAVRMLF